MKQILIPITIALLLTGSIFFYFKKPEPKKSVSKTFAIKYNNGNQADTVCSFYKCCTSTQLYNNGVDKYVPTNSIDTIIEVK